MDRSKYLYSVILGTAFVLYGSAFFWLTDGWLPGILGLLLLPVIIWAADALGFIERIRDQRPVRRHAPRQYLLLRSKVTLLLDIVRRVNWLAVDMNRGIRTASEVEAELDRAVVRMKELIDEIRGAAGLPSDEVDAPVSEAHEATAGVVARSPTPEAKPS